MEKFLNAFTLPAAIIGSRQARQEKGIKAL
jgi:hypothetical protein